MIELRGVVATRGARPVTARLRAGEVVRIDGAPAAVRALLDVIAGRRAPLGGEVAWRDDGTPVVVRAGEQLPTGVEPDAAALWAALAGGDVRSPDVVAAGRGRGARRPVWLVDGALDARAEAIIQAAAEDVRAGGGTMVWTSGASRARVDRVIDLDAAEPAPGARAGAVGRARAPRIPRGIAASVARFAVAAVTGRPSVALAALLALWVAVCAATIAVHEGYWYAEGSLAALAQIARVVAAGAVIAVATSSASAASAARAWPAMLRETATPRWLRAVVLVAGDASAALLPAAVAAVPAVWAAALGPDGHVGPVVILLMGVGVGVAAGALTRALRGGPFAATTGALGAAGLGLWLMW